MLNCKLINPYIKPRFLLFLKSMMVFTIAISCDMFDKPKNVRPKIILGIPGRELNEENKAYLLERSKEFDIVGIILNVCNTKISKMNPGNKMFSENVYSVAKRKLEIGEECYIIEQRDTIKKFIKDIDCYIKDLYEDKEKNVVMCADIEGGRVNIISNIISFPSQQELFEIYTNDNDRFIEIIENVAQAMLDLGFTHNLSPVIDLNCNFFNASKRNLCNDTDKTEEIAKKIINIYLKNGITPVLKHAPGLHFLTASENFAVDTHLSACTSSADISEIDSYLQLYKNLADYIRSKGAVVHIMLNHGVYESIDKNFSASISNKVVDHIKKLVSPSGETVVFVTDCMNMGGVFPKYTIDDYLSGKMEMPNDVIPIFVHDWRGTDFLNKNIY